MEFSLMLKTLEVSMEEYHTPLRVFIGGLILHVKLKTM
jgi:hypothetical protein